MRKAWVFEGQEQYRFYELRRNLLGTLLSSLNGGLNLRTVLDAGCGIGLFSNYLSSFNLKVTAIDGRDGNIEEARSRYPQVDFSVKDVESTRIRELGQFDLVVCFGLIYHLENPFRAIRNLHDVTAKILIVESIITPSPSPVATLMSEYHGEDQGLHYIAFIPSEACLIKMLYHAGFQEVYKAMELPDHDEFRETIFHQRKRTVLVASKVKLLSPLLQSVAEPQPNPQNIWLKKLASLGHSIHMAVRNLSSKSRIIFYNVFSRLPWPIHLRSIGWWLTWNDVMGRHIRFRDNFEQEEQTFLLRVCKPGMVFLDVGAHQGLYTLLASRKVGAEGQVIAFEPSPRELQRLRWNLSLNRCHNVRVEPFAVSRGEGRAELYVCLGQETGCNSLRPCAVSEPVRRVQVATTTIDSYLRKNRISKVDFMKVDVEGAELEVFQGALELLRISKPIIVCELSDVRTEPWGYRSAEIYDFLESLGYRWFSATAEGKLQPSPRKTNYDENLIAVPEEKLSEVAEYIVQAAAETHGGCC